MITETLTATTSTIEQIDPEKPLIVSTPQTAMALFDPVTAGIAKIQEFKSISLEVNGIAKVTECRIVAKKARCAVTNRQKELVEGAKKYQKDVDGAAKKIIAQIEPVETYLETQEAIHKKKLEEEQRLEEERKQIVLQARVDRLAKARCPAGNLAALGNMTDELFEWHLKDQTEKAEAARVKAEEERIERERVQREERERIQKEKAEREAAEKAEQERLRQIELSRPKVVEKVERLIPLEPNVVELPAPFNGDPFRFRPTVVPDTDPDPIAPSFQPLPSGRNVVFVEKSKAAKLIDQMSMGEELARANKKEGIANLLREARLEIITLRQAAGKVVKAINHQGDDGWEMLKQAVAELSSFVD